MSFKESDIQIIEDAIKYYDNKERNLAIQKLKEIPFFAQEINWFIMSIIQDLDYQDKGWNKNSAREYLVQALNWVKTHQGDDKNEKL